MLCAFLIANIYLTAGFHNLTARICVARLSRERVIGMKQQ
jgi:hypothetical protein